MRLDKGIGILGECHALNFICADNDDDIKRCVFLLKGVVASSIPLPLHGLLNFELRQQFPLSGWERCLCLYLLGRCRLGVIP